MNALIFSFLLKKKKVSSGQSQMGRMLWVCVSEREKENKGERERENKRERMRMRRRP